jgi:hypothetical protein
MFRSTKSATVVFGVLLLVTIGVSAGRGQMATGQPPQVPNPAPAGQPASQLTPQQVRDILYLRALQSRGSGRGVRTGFPQFVPFGNMGYGGFGMMPQQVAQPQATDPQTTKKSSAQKRAELREKREEQKRIAREEAKKKREAAKAKAAAKKAQPATDPAPAANP